MASTSEIAKRYFEALSAHDLDPQTGIQGGARVPRPAFNVDTEQARESIRKLAKLEPSIVWTGHAEPVPGDVRPQLERAASAPS